MTHTVCPPSSQPRFVPTCSPAFRPPAPSAAGPPHPKHQGSPQQLSDGTLRTPGAVDFFRILNENVRGRACTRAGVVCGRAQRVRHRAGGQVEHHSSTAFSPPLISPPASFRAGVCAGGHQPGGGALRRRLPRAQGVRLWPFRRWIQGPGRGLGSLATGRRPPRPQDACTPTRICTLTRPLYPTPRTLITPLRFEPFAQIKLGDVRLHGLPGLIPSPPLTFIHANTLPLTKPR